MQIILDYESQMRMHFEVDKPVFNSFNYNFNKTHLTINGTSKYFFTVERANKILSRVNM